MAEANPTLADLLFGAPGGEGADAAAGARAAIERGEFPEIRARVNERPEISWPAASGAIADALKDALDVTLADVLKGAWAKANELDAALKRPAGETTLVPLAEHTVKSVHHPEVEVVARHPVAGGAPAQERVIATLVFDVEFVLTLEGVVLKVRDGSIAEITSGTLAARATLKCEGAELIKRDTAKFELPGKLKLAGPAAGEPPLPAEPVTPPATAEDLPAAAADRPPEPESPAPAAAAPVPAQRRAMGLPGAVVLGLIVAGLAIGGLWFIRASVFVGHIDEVIRPFVVYCIAVFAIVLPLIYRAKRARATSRMRPLLTTVVLVLLFYWVSFATTRDPDVLGKSWGDMLLSIGGNLPFRNGVVEAWRALIMFAPALIVLAALTLVFCVVLDRSLHKARMSTG